MKTFIASFGTSRGRDTYGYNTITLRDQSGAKIARECGGGYDMWNSLLCGAIAKLYQAKLQAAMQGVPEVDGSHALKNHYCFYRLPDNRITVDGGGGESVTRKLKEILGIKITETKVDSRKRVVNIIE